MRLMRLGYFCVAICLCIPASAGSADWWRPCGPGNSCGGNRLVAQGAGGADFRWACAQHDACLESGGDRAGCDRQFLYELEQACECADNPRRCRAKARHFYRTVRLYHTFFQ